MDINFIAIILNILCCILLIFEKSVFNYLSNKGLNFILREKLRFFLALIFSVSFFVILSILIYIFQESSFFIKVNIMILLFNIVSFIHTIACVKLGVIKPKERKRKLDFSENYKIFLSTTSSVGPILVFINEYFIKINYSMIIFGVLGAISLSLLIVKKTQNYDILDNQKNLNIYFVLGYAVMDACDSMNKLNETPNVFIENFFPYYKIILIYYIALPYIADHVLERKGIK